MTEIFSKNFFEGRIQNFLAFKGIVFSQYKKIFSFHSFPPKSSEDSIKMLRDIEEKFPYPIGFIGPIEPLFQWATMVVASYSSFIINTEIFESICNEIEDKVEEEYFVMGPTFSVADCVLFSDLQEMEKIFLLPKPIKDYTRRVNNVLKNCGIHP